MLAQWIGDIVGQMHNNKINAKELAGELGWHEKYLSCVLNSENPPKKAEGMVRGALNNIISRKVPVTG